MSTEVALISPCKNKITNKRRCSCTNVILFYSWKKMCSFMFSWKHTYWWDFNNNDNNNDHHRLMKIFKRIPLRHCFIPWSKLEWHNTDVTHPLKTSIGTMFDYVINQRWGFQNIWGSKHSPLDPTFGHEWPQKYDIIVSIGP